jgi:hypothetical protein
MTDMLETYDLVSDLWAEINDAHEGWDEGHVEIDETLARMRFACELFLKESSGKDPVETILWNVIALYRGGSALEAETSEYFRGAIECAVEAVMTLIGGILDAKTVIWNDMIAAVHSVHLDEIMNNPNGEGEAAAGRYVQSAALQLRAHAAAQRAA